MDSDNIDACRAENEANAQAIAALPDLIEALQTARNALHNKYGYTTTDKAQKAVEAIDNALEKAGVSCSG
jgi:hypothetical protein